MASVVDYGTQPPVFRCTHCNNTKPCSLPLTISQFVLLAREFESEHKDCWKLKKATP